jgi:glycine cleavage system H protein
MVVMTVPGAAGALFTGEEILKDSSGAGRSAAIAPLGDSGAVSSLFAFKAIIMSKSLVDATAHYLKTHEWARPAGDEIVVGISDHAQQAMGDLVYVELPRVGESIAAGERFGVVESVKAASDVYMPVAGEVVAVNGALETAPDDINRDPYGSGWMIRVRPTNPADLAALLDATAYRAQLDAEEA